jgi:uncharacterized LabA/DUF88 family protein
VPKKRASVFVDGFNLYHSIHNLNRNYLKWLDLRGLVEEFVPASDFDLVSIKYFSAYAEWLPGPYARHKAFVAATKSQGVEVILGNFKVTYRYCKLCRRTFKSHEEKETDVNLGIHMVNDAHRNRYDIAFLLSADSDLVPAVKMVRAETGKPIRAIFPVNYRSSDLRKAVGGLAMCAEMKPVHLEHNLLPQNVVASDGTVVCARPTEYDPAPIP